MPYLDRADFIALLEKLGAADDAEVLTAAREIQRRIEAAETKWDELLARAPGTDASDALEELDDPDIDVGGFEIRDRRREPERPLPELPPVPEPQATIHSEELHLIESLLRRPTLSTETRRELMDLRTDIAENDFADMDRTYLRDLAARLNARDRED